MVQTLSPKEIKKSHSRVQKSIESFEGFKSPVTVKSEESKTERLDSAYKQNKISILSPDSASKPLKSILKSSTIETQDNNVFMQEYEQEIKIEKYNREDSKVKTLIKQALKTLSPERKQDTNVKKRMKEFNEQVRKENRRKSSKKRT